MNIKPPTDEDMKTVLFDDWVWDRETDDHSPPKDAIGKMPEGVSMLGGYIDEKIIGLFITHPFRDGVKVHFAVLRKYRRHAREFLQMALNTTTKRVYCQVAECYPEVINFARKNGFVDIERSGAFMKNGTIHQRRTLCLS